MGSTGLVSVDGFETIEFNNKTNLVINAGAGSDQINLNNPTAPAGLTGITVNGADPTASDTVVVNGTAGIDAISIASLTEDGAVITGAGPVMITVNTAEHLIVNGNGGNDTLTVTASASDEVILTPGASEDAGSLSVQSDKFGPFQQRIPLAYQNLGAGGELTVASDSGDRDLDLHVRGTETGDQFDVNANGRVQILRTSTNFFKTIPIDTPGVGELILEGLASDDIFNIVGDHPFLQGVDLAGGQPDSGSDVLNFTGAGAGAVTVNLDNSTVQETDFGPVSFAGIETLNVDAGASPLTVDGTSGDDTVDVTPADATSGVLQANGNAPMVNYSNLGVTFTVNGAGGEDTIIVYGNETGETFTISDASVTVGGQTLDYTAEALTVDGQQGNDIFDVTSGAIPIFIDGGDPIGSVGDMINLLPAGVPTFSPGPNGDTGGFEIAGAEPVSYDHIEAITVNLTNAGGAAIVMGTGADDDVTVLGTGANSANVTVNDGPTISYTGVTSFTLEGKAGDDDIDIELNDLSIATFTVIGGLPTANQDTVTISGEDGAFDDPTWAPGGPESGTFTISGGQAVTLEGIERVIFDGEDDGEFLTIAGTATGNTIVHRPGVSIDSGSLQVDTRLAIEYVNLGRTGAVVADGGDGTDTVVTLGTQQTDSLVVQFPATGASEVLLTTAEGTHVPVRATNIENQRIDTLEGDDVTNVGTAVDIIGTLAIIGGGNGDGSDILNLNGAAATVENVTIAPDATNPDDQDITGLGASIDVTGIELIRYSGADTDDSLTVDPGQGDNQVRVEAAAPPGSDLVTSDSLPDIEFTGLENFVVDASSQGSDVVAFKTWFLQGAMSGNYQMIGGGVDTLVIEGSDGANNGDDRFRVTNASAALPAGPVAITDGNGMGVTVTATGPMQGRLQINTLGGDDTVTVDESDGLITPLIGYDGGTGSDVLNVVGTTAVTEVVYNPGPDVTEGRLAYDGVMTIDFVNLEPVVDFVTAASLIVNGTNANNAINYTGDDFEIPDVGTVPTGLVSIDGFETIEFANKTRLIIDGLAGSDEIHLNNPTTPVGLTDITVDGGDPTAASDRLVVNSASGANETLIVRPGNQGAGTVDMPATLAGDLDYANIETIDLVGQIDEADSFGVDGTVDFDLFSYSIGSTPDAGFIEGIMSNATFTLPRINFREMNPRETRALNIFRRSAGDTVQVVTTDLPEEINYAASTVEVIVRFNPFTNLNVGTLVGGGTTESVGIRSKDGSDVFTITPDPLAAVGAFGGQPDSGSDILNVIGNGIGDLTLDLTDDSILEAGVGLVVFEDIEVVNIDANAALTIEGTDQNDVFNVTPTGVGNDGSFDHSRSIGMGFSYTDATTATFNGNGGTADEINILGDAVADTITSAADAVIVDGSTVTIGAGLEALQVHGLGGDDNINLGALIFPGEITIHGNDGNDTLIGSPQDDTSFGGPGNDILIGGGGSDTQYGEDGQDIFGNPTLTPNSIADDPGTDFNFGGGGFDNFVWEPGDGTDFNNGGDDGADIFRFFGRDGADTFTLRSGGTPTHFNAIFNATVIDNHGIEDVLVDPLGGNDVINVDDLFATEVVNVTILAGSGDETINVEGRDTADDLTVTRADNLVQIEGLTYDIRIPGSAPADALTMNLRDGDDQVHVAAGVEAQITSTLNGESGSDLLTGWFNTANGGLDNDTIIGAANNQIINGDAGDDTVNGNGGTDNVDGGAGADTIWLPGTQTVDAFSLALNTTGHLLTTAGGGVSTIYTAPTFAAFSTADFERILVEGEAGDDTLSVNVEATAGSDVIGTPITFRGGDGEDALNTFGAPQTPVDVTEYTAGAAAEEGRVEFLGAPIGTGGPGVPLMTIDFYDLEPFVDTVVAGILTVNANDAANSITYRGGGPNSGLVNLWNPAGDTTGIVANDLDETYEFANKGALFIHAHGGSDEISLNAEITPTSLNFISVVGGAPTAGSDTAIVSGTPANDAIDFSPTADDLATVTITGQVPINLIGIESAVIDGQGGGDTLTYTSPAGRDNLIVTPGITPDTGQINGHRLGGPSESLMPLSFTGLDASGDLVLADVGQVRTDTAEIRGTNEVDDIDVTTAGLILITDTVGNRHLVNVTAPGVNVLMLQGLNGDDTFNIQGDHPFSGNISNFGIYIEGGNPDSGSDVLNFLGSGSNAIVANIEGGTITETASGIVALTGIETANIDSDGADLTIVTTSGNDTTVVTPTGTNAGTLVNNDTSPVINFSSVDTLRINQNTGDDTLRINYTTNTDVIDVNIPAGMISDGLNETINFANPETESVQVFGSDDDDTFNVVADPNIPVFIDGGDPIGTSPGDTLNVIAGGMAVVAEPGPENDEGGISVGVNERISYDHIEALVVTDPAKAFIAGTGADDDITIIARDASTHIGADGIQDFTSEVNAGAPILWLNAAVIVIDARSGDDDIVFRVPAPNDADWDIDAWVFGGAPAAGPGDEGDRLVVETPQTSGPDSILYIPTGVDSGNLTIDENNNGIFDGTDTMIQIGNVPVMPAMPDVPLPDPGGIELLIYDGGSGDDTVTVLGDIATSGSFHHVPGSLLDQGFVGVAAEGDTQLGLNYENLGLDGSVTIDGRAGDNDLTVFGTDGADAITVNFMGPGAADIELQTSIGTHVDLLTNQIQNYIIETLDGDDDINLVATIDASTFVVRGGGPSRI